jgi:hypothetical protein
VDLQFAFRLADGKITSLETIHVATISNSPSNLAEFPRLLSTMWGSSRRLAFVMPAFNGT